MASLTVTTEFAGRLISIGKVGATVGMGEDVALIETMKMEIPVSSPTSGQIRAFLTQVDEMVEEGQAVLVIET